MKKYMVVYKTDEGETCAEFFEEWNAAERCRMGCECGMGWYAEVYERIQGKGGREYRLIYA